MSFYRNTYLKSDHWKGLRLEKLAATETMCAICGHRSISNDVHHIDYKRSLFEVKKEDLRILCRKCHTSIHDILDTHPSLKLLTPKDRWTEAHRIFTDRIRDEKIAGLYDKKIREQQEPLRDWMPVLISLYELGANAIAIKITKRIQFLNDRADKARIEQINGNQKRRDISIIALIHSETSSIRGNNKLFRLLRRLRMTLAQAREAFPKPENLPGKNETSAGDNFYPSHTMFSSTQRSNYCAL